MIQLAHRLVKQGKIGEITGFRGRHAENYMASPEAPHSFRTDPRGGGALADIGSHILSIARFLVGPIESVNGALATVIAERPVSAGSTELAPVQVDDQAHVLIRFDNGVLGAVEVNWAATGRSMDLSFEITGTKGAIAFSQERMNELNLYCVGGSADVTGYTRIESGPDHPPYDRFCPAQGHHLGFNDLKVIEVAGLIQAYVGGGTCYPDFAEAYAVQETVDTVHRSAEKGTWVTVPNRIVGDASLA